MKFHSSRKSLKKLSIVALALLPLGYATAASAEPVFQTPIPTAGALVTGITFDQSGNPIIGNWNYNSGSIQTLIDGQLTPPVFAGDGLGVLSVTTDLSGNLWVTNYFTSTIQEFINGAPQSPVTISTDGCYFSCNWGITTTPSGEIVVSNPSTFDSNNNLTGTITNLGTPQDISNNAPAIYSASGIAYSIASDGSGNIWSVDGGQQLTEYVNGAVQQTIALGISSGAFGVAVDPSGNVWVVGLSTGDIQEVINGQAQPVIHNDIRGEIYAIGINRNGQLYIGGGDGDGFIQEVTGAVFPTTTGPNTVSNLAVSTVGHTTLKLTWGSDNSSDTQYVCTASNGASVTVTGNSCSLKGFDLYHSGNYTVSVTAVNSQGQSDPVTLNVQL